MSISFVTVIDSGLDTDVTSHTWTYNSTDELKKEWMSDNIDMKVPENDAIIHSVCLNDNPCPCLEGTTFLNLLCFLKIFSED